MVTRIVTGMVSRMVIRIVTGMVSRMVTRMVARRITTDWEFRSTGPSWPYRPQGPTSGTFWPILVRF